MAHRGRLNVLANIVGKPLAQIFSEFEGNVDPERDPGLGRREVPPRRHRHAPARPGGETLAVSVAPNPSHLECVDPVVEGMVRAKQDAHRRQRARARAARSCSTATPRSPARASWPRR